MEATASPRRDPDGLLARSYAISGAAMAPKGHPLAFAAVFVVAGCLFLRLLISVVTTRPLW